MNVAVSAEKILDGAKSSSVREKLIGRTPKSAKLSKEGQAFIDDVEEDDGLKTKYSSSASEDIIYSLQDEWSINFFLDD